MPHKQETPFDLPGLNLPIHYKPEHNGDGFRCANALDEQDIEDDLCGYTFTLRELTMMRIIEMVTDKPDWDKKVHNEEILNKWRDEITASGQDVSPAMIDYIFAELKWKAEEYEKSGIVTAYDPGVVKSDLAIPADLQTRLQAAVKPLEDIPEEEKDYHPRSDNKVVDLVHPSLFPLIHGRTLVLRDSLIGVDDCFSRIGQGLPLREPGLRIHRSPPGILKTHSENFQWLPSNVEFTANGECRTASYINNLHPAKHRNLYKIIEEILTRTIPLWNITLARRDDLPYRIDYKEVEFPEDGEPQPEEEEDDGDDYFEIMQEWQDRQHVVPPEPDLFKPPSSTNTNPVNLQKQFAEKGLQVIVKLANIELTPDKPTYEGGSWHIEGQLNERICATAIYYYSSSNITTNTLSFRHRFSSETIEEVHYEQSQFQFLRVFGFDFTASEDYHDYDGEFTQDLGSVETREGRLLTFPNTLQHCVSPFELVDKTKAGHRKILAFFLIDPNRRVISTANVPPQREDWCNEWKSAVREALAPRLPVELQEMVQRGTEWEPMGMEEAKEWRLNLMNERSVQSEFGNKAFEVGHFSLCEH
ncbi:hypothetical protein BJY04DRAFT_217497 [Aspergillus karnatakaensis]|uniref:DUF4246 domain-containing protein n=1 Tax=Aspergillus karnatakaensis TaxID=1810916 RepID=UPI003CCDBF3E